MKRTTLLLAIVLALLVGSSAAAQIGGRYNLSWSTSDAGGGSSRGGSYVLAGTLGQPDAGVLRGGSYALNGGFWNEALVARSVYLPLILRH
jgi:hypothetical protein